MSAVLWSVFGILIFYLIICSYIDMKSDGHNELLSMEISKDIQSSLHPITLFIVSCARWDLLTVTIESFEYYNTYDNVFEKYVIDDCNDIQGFQYMANLYGELYGYKFYHSYIYNITLPEDVNPSVREMFVLYQGFNISKTKYVLQIEDDWRFYRYGFIEDSLKIYNDKYIMNKYNITFLSLRMFEKYRWKRGHYRRRMGSRHHFRAMCGIGGNVFYTINNDNREPIIFNTTNNDYSFYRQKIKNDKHGKLDKMMSWGPNPGLKNRDLFLKYVTPIMNKIKYYNESDIIKNDLHEYNIGTRIFNDYYRQVFSIHNGYVAHIGEMSHVKSNKAIRKNFNFQNSEYRHYARLFIANNFSDIKINTFFEPHKVIEWNKYWNLHEYNCTFISKNYPR